MKRLYAIACFALLAAAPVHGAEKHDLKPLHGGVVVEANHVDYELVVKPELVALHLRDHGKPVPVTGGTAKLTLLSGTEKQDLNLAPAGDRFEVKGSFKHTAGDKAVAVVTLSGKPARTVRFVLK